MTATRSDQGRRLLDEALRLLDVVQATRPAGARQGGGEHPHSGAGAECRACPVCRGIAYLREVDPQAVERLTGAVGDIASAVRDLLAAAPAPPHGHEPGSADQGPGAGAPAPDPVVAGPDRAVPRVSVQKIDVTD